MLKNIKSRINQEPNNFAIVIPAYNVHKTIDDVVLKSLKYISRKKIFLIDDGSSIDISKIAEKRGIEYHRHKSNKGKGEALKKGFRLALNENVDWVFTIDGDGQHDPDLIPVFIQYLEKSNSDMIIGKREFQFNRMPCDRIFSNTVSSLILSIVLNRKIVDSQCGFRLIKAELLSRLFLSSSRYDIETEMIIKTIRMGGNISFLPIHSSYYGCSSSIKRVEDTVRFCKLILKTMFDQ